MSSSCDCLARENHDVTWESWRHVWEWLRHVGRVVESILQLIWIYVRLTQYILTWTEHILSIAGWSLSIFVAFLYHTPPVNLSIALSISTVVLCSMLKFVIMYRGLCLTDTLMISSCCGNMWWYLVLGWEFLARAGHNSRAYWCGHLLVRYTLVFYIVVWFNIVSFLKGCDVFTKGTAIFKLLRLSALLLIDIFFHILIWAPYRYLRFQWFMKPW